MYTKLLWLKHYVERSYGWLVEYKQGIVLNYIKKTIRYEILLTNGKVICFERIYLSCYRIFMKIVPLLISVIMFLIKLLLITSLEIILKYDLFPYLAILFLIWLVRFLYNRGFFDWFINGF